MRALPACELTAVWSPARVIAAARTPMIPAHRALRCLIICPMGIADDVNAFREQRAAEQSHALAQQRQTREVNWTLTKRALDEIAPEIARECEELGARRLEKWFSYGWPLILPTEFSRPGAKSLPRLSVWFLRSGEWKLLGGRSLCRASRQGNLGTCVKAVRAPDQAPEGWHNEDFLTAYGIRQAVIRSLQEQHPQNWHMH